MKKRYISILIFLTLLSISYTADSNAGQKIKVGVYNFKPLVFIDEAGRASGLFTDILDYIALKEGWEITYIPGSWSECLSRIEAGEIDIQVAIAYSKEREINLSFSEYLIIDWASVFKQKGSDIQTIFDLQDKVVSVVKSGITIDEFKRVIEQFNIKCRLIEKNENIENLEAVHNKEAEAGVCPNIYGTTVEHNYNIERTPIVFSPIKLGFAVNRKGDQELLLTLNRYISEMRADQDSVYYSIRDRWISGYKKDNITPEWLFTVMWILSALFITLAVFSVVLKKRVKAKTSELVDANRKLALSEENYRILFEQAKDEIKERKIAEKALKESEEIFDYLMKYSPVYIFFKDEQIRALRLSNNYETMLGKPLKELIGKTMDDLFPSDLAKSMIQDDIRILNEGKEIVVEEEFNGRHYSTIKFPINIEGRPSYLAGYTIDITDRKIAEQENLKLQEQLLQSHKIESIGRLAGGVAHDFNNMLGVIIGHVELLIDRTDIPEDARNGLKAIQNAANRSADLTKQLLAFARKQTINPQIINLNEAVEGMLSMVERLIGEDIDLIWIGSQNVGKVEIDPAQIDQIIVNLCVNAKDAILDKSEDEAEKTGRITIETGKAVIDKSYCVDNFDAKPGRYLILAVSDNGCGIENERLPMIFDPFFTTKEVHKGTGLGLASVYGIVKQNRGFINVYSELGEGTTFRIYLPEYCEDDNTNVDDTPECSIEELPEVGDETILLVEDELWLLELGETMLKRLGYTVLTASSPKEAVNIAENYPNKIDLLLTDVIMPEMNGRELAKKLADIRPNLKSIFMSGYTANVIAHHGVLDQDIYFIQKPFSIQELSKQIREVFKT